MGANQLLCSFPRVAFGILRSLTDPRAPGRTPPRGLQPLSARASFMAALYARIAIGIDPLSGSRLSVRAQMYAGPSSRTDAADDASVVGRMSAKLFAGCIRTAFEGCAGRKERSMNLVVWLPALFALGLVSMGVCYAFVSACEEI